VHQQIEAVFDSYGDAESAVRDLELTGIVGEQVEIIGNTDEDIRTADLPARKKRSGRDRVRDDPGHQPEYIGRQEFYATHVREGRTVLIVRGSLPVAETAKGILAAHGGRTPSGDDLQITQVDDRPRAATGSA
jgi:hypothetical protein